MSVGYINSAKGLTEALKIKKIFCGFPAGINGFFVIILLGFLWTKL